jgi:hypothetical protein
MELDNKYCVQIQHKTAVPYYINVLQMVVQDEMRTAEETNRSDLPIMHSLSALDVENS